MPGILDTLPGRKTSDDLDAALQELNAEIIVKQSRLAEVRNAAAAAAFEAGAASVEALQADARAIEDDLNTFRAIVAETKRRADAARRSERLASAQASFEEMKLARIELVTSWEEYDRWLASLTGEVTKIINLSDFIRVGNETSRIEGFPEMQIRLPGTHFSQIQEALATLRKISLSATLRELERTKRTLVTPQ